MQAYEAINGQRLLHRFDIRHVPGFVIEAAQHSG